jgi:hypothetical protein
VAVLQPAGRGGQTSASMSASRFQTATVTVVGDVQARLRPMTPTPSTPTW